MMRLFKNKKAQQTAEDAILIAFVIAAAMAIQTYVKRGLQAKVRDAVIKYTTDVGTSLGGTSDSHQYEPYYLQSDFKTSTTLEKSEQEETQGSWNRDYNTDSSARSGTQDYTASADNG